jgi:hypothetical protein
LQNLQDTIHALKYQYRDVTLEFKALHLAWEAVRLAWYAVAGNRDGMLCHWDDLEAAVKWLARDLEVSRD